MTVVWNPLENDYEMVRVHHPAEKLDHAKREIITARYYEFPYEAITQYREIGGVI